MAESSGRPVIGPTEFAVLVKVYNEALAEPWFATDESQRHQFRRYIIAKFREGMTDTAELMAHCLEVARLRFSTVKLH